MKENKFKYFINNQDYSLSPYFKTEKMYDEARYYVMSASLFDSFNPQNMSYYAKKDEYSLSSLSFYKECLFDGCFAEKKEIDKVMANSMTVSVTVKNNKKTMTFKELKLNDYIINYYNNKQKLQKYIQCFDEYKSNKDKGQLNKFYKMIYGGYNSINEKKAIHYLLDNCQKAYSLLTKENSTLKEEKLVEDWVKYLTISDFELSYKIADYYVKFDVSEKVKNLSQSDILKLFEYNNKFDEKLSSNDKIVNNNELNF